MITRASVPVVALLAAAACAAVPSAAGVSAAPATPVADSTRLVVLLVVDQLPADLLDRYDAAFTGGFRRIRDRGLRFSNATHDHAVTETAPGHATIATGTEPARHGVPANDWWEQEEGGQLKLVLNVVDPTVPLVGYPTLAGAAPTVLRRSGLGEWMQAADSESRVVSVSGKDRGAVLLAAHSRGLVYWFDPTVAGFVTSVHYRDDDPDWITAFNDEVVADARTDSVWSLTVPDELRALARPDTFPWEADGVHTAFPHRLGELSDEGGAPDEIGWFMAATPTVDALTLRLAERAVAEESLGRDDHPDLLAVSLSQTDRIGHAYGPTSLEQLDNLLRLDEALGAFLDALDASVGPEHYLVAFTSDHGVMELPEVRAANGLPGLRLTRDSAATLQEVVNAVAREVGTGDPDALARGLAEAAPTVAWVDRAWTRSALAAGPVEADSFTRLHVASEVADRPTGLLARAGVVLQFSEGVVTWGYPFGAAHSTPYLYDRHVPLVFVGPGLEPGVRTDAASAADLAPTLAALLGIAHPDDLDGTDLRIR
ncbi:MAG: alkaline phosphatase family protein [Longimicrobiales bacterium]